MLLLVSGNNMQSVKNKKHKRDWGNEMLRYLSIIRIKIVDYCIKYWTSLQATPGYLTVLHEHTLQKLSRKFAKNYHTDTFRYFLTVPAAVWSDGVGSLMRQAAIPEVPVTYSDPDDRLILITESDAAVLYCEETMSDQIQLKNHDHIMVCYVGSGSVDLVIFQVNFYKQFLDDVRLYIIFLVGRLDSFRYLYQKNGGVWNIFQDTRVKIIYPEELAVLAVIRRAVYSGVHPRGVVS
ncbi:hypothetical protein BDA99DRAFT_534321 [Phascolomyces articulosus]|uniref:Uncharacterized protein n=1 Tax=Phascolomyces articulosus TaxID=60185 RepID=A0AAD5PHI1_9FUNG|nr:hypothetical protein BDA99DRAFT_534321 [Phascolomyces articulosus]